MNTKLAITAILIALMSFAFTSQVLAQVRVPGVATGDTFTYSLVTHWASENASESVPQSFIGLNLTTKYVVSIGGIINGTIVDATHLWYLSNETNPRPYLYTVELVSGTPNDTSGSYPPLLENVIGANLKAGDLLHPSGNDLVTINQTITRNYASGSRPTNVVELNGPITNETTDSNNQTVTQTVGYQDVTYYIDQATGILVLENTTISSTIPVVESGSIIWTLTSTNLWNAQQASVLNDLPLIIGVVVVVVVVVAVAGFLIFRKPKGGRRRR